MQEILEGLYLVKDIIDQPSEKKLLSLIEKEKWGEWNTELSRWTQQYGYKYDYNRFKIDEKTDVKPIPEELKCISDLLYQHKLIDQINQSIVNRYLPGEGIAAHSDKDIFGDCVSTISLKSDIVMRFSGSKLKSKLIDKKYKIETDSKGEFIDVLLPRRSILIMRGYSRYNVKHEIRKRKTDVFRGKKFKRDERISITLRNFLEK